MSIEYSSSQNNYQLNCLRYFFGNGSASDCKIRSPECFSVRLVALEHFSALAASNACNSWNVQGDFAIQERNPGYFLMSRTVSSPGLRVSAIRMSYLARTPCVLVLRVG